LPFTIGPASGHLCAAVGVDLCAGAGFLVWAEQLIAVHYPGVALALIATALEIMIRFLSDRWLLADHPGRLLLAYWSRV
jgi:hypothetical protein